MYQDYFGLRETPFNANPDPHYLYMTREIEEAIAGLVYGIETRTGFMTLIGEVGTGKTTLLNRLLEWLGEHKIRASFLFNSRINSSQLFDFILAEFEIPCESKSKSQQLLQLNHWLLERHRANQTAVLIIDEAQNLTYPVLEEIRLLTNLETATAKLVQIILAGQPELDEKLKLPQLRQLRQRITVRCTTSTLTREQVHEYVAERLRIAGANEVPIFSEEAMEVVHKYSKGVPRVINLLCQHALIAGYADQQRPIPPTVIEEIAHEFQLDEVEPIAPPGSLAISQDVYNSESFLQNLGEALSRFRMNPTSTPPAGDRKQYSHPRLSSPLRRP